MTTLEETLVRNHAEFLQDFCKASNCKTCIFYNGHSCHINEPFEWDVKASLQRVSDGEKGGANYE